MNEAKQHQPWSPVQGISGLNQYPNQPPPEPIRKPSVVAALDNLEKQLSELGEQWERCYQKISPVVSPFPCSPPSDCCDKAPEECGPTMALRISKISRKAKDICDAIRETTNQIEL
jgi:hypothetical protein